MTSDTPIFGVGMWEHARTNTNRRQLMTLGLAACVGIALHNPRTATAYMAHFPVTWKDTDDFWNFIRCDGAITPDTQAWLRGGQINYADNREKQSIGFGRHNRQWAIDQLQSAGMRSAAIDAQWDDRQMGTAPGTIIALNADTGVFESRLGILADATAWFGEKAVNALLSRQPYAAPVSQV